jgi:hypothetical protein
LPQTRTVAHTLAAIKDWRFLGHAGRAARSREVAR